MMMMTSSSSSISSSARKWFLTLLVVMVLCHSTKAFSVRMWQRNMYNVPPQEKREEVVEEIGGGGVVNSMEDMLRLNQQQRQPLFPLCRGSRDKEPMEYSCADQAEWGKCNETWLIEGGYCAEACGRCRDRIPVQLADDDGESDLMLETRSRSSSRMPDVGAKKCGGHIAYEWRIRTNKAKEASGLAASRLNDHVLWTHVDGWTTKVLAFLSETFLSSEGGFGLQGQPVLEFELPHWVNKNPKSGRVDWEDISTAQCPDGSKRQCLWISDTGNNKFTRGYSQVIAVVEPEIKHIKMDPQRKINTEYFTPNQVDKRNRAGICQPGMGGSNCQHHKCKSDETNFEYMDFDSFEKTQEGESLWVFTFKYPGKKEKDSEGLAVAPDGSRFWLFEKNEEVRGANVYESEILFDTVKRSGGSKNKYIRVELFSIAFLKPPCVAAGTDCVSYEEDYLFSITGADVHPRGKSVVLQTYKGPFVYEFDEERPFDISGMQDIVPRAVLHYRDGWGAEAIAYSHHGDRLWQMPEENRHDGCQKVLTMDCSQENLALLQKDLLEVRSDANITRGEVPDMIGDMIDVKEKVEHIDEELEELVEEIEQIAAEKPLVCEVIPNGWGTEKNASIPICAGPDRVPQLANSTEKYSCEDQAAWGKCEDDWLVEGNFCMGACGRCTHTTCSCPDCKRLEKPQLLCNAGQVIRSETANASKVVIFDFDDTIKLHHPARQAPEALWALEEVHRLGYGIAIATASCHTDYVKGFLADMKPEIFTPEFLESNAFQSCQKKKTGALKCNLAHYGLLDKPDCAVFFDDSISNEKYADKAGIQMIEVQKGVGVTKDKLKQGLDFMLNNCGRRKACADKPIPGEHTCREQFKWGKCNETWLVEGNYCAESCGRCNLQNTTTEEGSLQ